MQYMILIWGDEQASAAMPQEAQQAEFAAYMAYSQEMAQTGVLRGGAPLHPAATSKRVHVDAAGKLSVKDGPYADTKEQLAGYYLVECADEKAAIGWAAKCPGAKGASFVEVREVVPVGGPQ